MIPKHLTYVQVTIHGRYFASCCRCGCDLFPTRNTLWEAEADARSHGTLEHIYESLSRQ